MAYEYKTKKTTQEEEQQATPTVQAWGSSAAPGASFSGQPQTTQNQGSGFVNFDRIINANKDAAKSSAAKLTGTLQTAGANAQQGLASTVGNFSQQVNQNRVAAPGGTIWNPTTAMGSVLTPEEQQNFNNPTDELGAQAARRNAEEAVYKGPTDITKEKGFDEMWANLGKAERDVDALGQDGGVQALIQKYLASQAMSDGAGRLDAALLGATGGKEFRDLQQKYGNLRGEGDTLISQAAQQADDAANFGDMVKDYWTGKADTYDKQKATDERVAKDRTAAEKKRREAQEAWEKYNKPTLLSAARDITNFLDPTYYIGRAFGFRGINDNVTDMWDGNTNENTAHVRDWALAPEAREAWKTVFPALSETELRELEQMPVDQQSAWIMKYKADMEAGRA